MAHQNMLTKAKTYLGNAKNRQLLSWLGGGVVVAISGLWAVWTFYHQGAAPSSPVTANCNSVAANGNISGVTINSNTASCSSSK